MSVVHRSSLLGIDANLLVLLDALLQYESVSKAADHAALTQSALSHALGRLRLHFDDELLSRAGREMVVTPRGMELQPYVRSAVMAMEQVFAPQPNFSPAGLTQSFALIMGDLLEQTLLPEIDKELQSESPGVDLQTLPAAMDSIAEMRQGRADAAVMVRAELPADFDCTTMMQGEYAIVMRHDHPLAKGRLTLKEYVEAAHVLVAPSGTRGCSMADDLLAEKGYKRRVSRRVSSFWAAVLLVSKSDYIASLPTAAVQAVNSLVNLKIKTSPFPLGSFDYNLVWHKRTNEDAAQLWFRQLILDCAQRVAASGLS